MPVHLPETQPGRAALDRSTRPQFVHADRTHNFVVGFCFDGGAGQSLSIEALKDAGNALAAPDRQRVRQRDQLHRHGSRSNPTSTTRRIIQPILITQTGRYILIMADLDGAPNGPLNGDVAVLLTDITGGSALLGPHLGIDPVTGQVVVIGGGITPQLTPGISTPSVFCPGSTFTCEELTCAEAYACLPFNPGLDGDGDGVPCENVCPGG